MGLVLQNLNQMIDINYCTQFATQKDIYKFLLKCDSDFNPPLSSEVELNEFSEKIYKDTIHFEAWFNSELIGLLSIYLNDKNSGIGFINHISILRKYQGNGISRILINECFEYAEGNGFNYVRLEVSKTNHVAQKLYNKYSFVIEKDSYHKIQMIKNLNLGEA